MKRSGNVSLVLAITIIILGFIFGSSAHERDIIPIGGSVDFNNPSRVQSGQQIEIEIPNHVISSLTNFVCYWGNDSEHITKFEKGFFTTKATLTIPVEKGFYELVIKTKCPNPCILYLYYLVE